MAFVAGDTVDLIAYTGGDVPQHIGGRRVQVAVGVGQEPAVGTIFVSRTENRGTMRIGETIGVVVDTITRFCCGLTGQQHGFTAGIPYMIDGTTVRSEWWCRWGCYGHGVR